MKCKVELQPTTTGGVYGILLTCEDTTLRSKILKYVDQYFASSHVEEFKSSAEGEPADVMIVFEFDRIERLEKPSNVRGLMAQNYFLVLKRVVEHMGKSNG